VQEEVGNNKNLIMDDNSIQNILFLDIETVPQQADYNKLDERWQKLWDKKASKLAKNGETAEELYPRAGIYAEFGKVICISVGFVSKTEGKIQFRIKSFFGDDEHKILSDFCEMLEAKFDTNVHFLCAHNGKEFDFPYLCRRILANAVQMPKLLDLSGKKPWEVKHLDTMQLWKFGDFKSYTSLDLLAAVFNIPTPKDDIDGSMIYSIYYHHNDLNRIKVYCQKDVLTLASIFLQMNNLPAILPEQVVEVD